MEVPQGYIQSFSSNLSFYTPLHLSFTCTSMPLTPFISTHTSLHSLLSPCSTHPLPSSPLTSLTPNLLNPHSTNTLPCSPLTIYPHLIPSQTPSPFSCPPLPRFLQSTDLEVCPYLPLSPIFCLGSSHWLFPLLCAFPRNSSHSITSMSSQCKCHLIRRASSLPLFESHRRQDFIRAVCITLTPAPACHAP